MLRKHLVSTFINLANYFPGKFAMTISDTRFELFEILTPDVYGSRLAQDEEK